MNTTNMMQCILRHETGSIQHVWIEADFAEVGRILKIKNRGTGEWENGWKVTEAFLPMIPADVIAENERNYKNHRKATDI